MTTVYGMWVFEISVSYRKNGTDYGGASSGVAWGNRTFAKQILGEQIDAKFRELKGKNLRGKKGISDVVVGGKLVAFFTHDEWITARVRLDKDPGYNPPGVELPQVV